MNNPVHVKRDFAGIITLTDLKIGKITLMTPLNDPAQTTWALESRALSLQLESEIQQKENSEPSEAHVELDMMHCYWP